MQTQFIGDIRIDRLLESDGAFADADFLFPDIDPALLEQHKQWLYPRFVEPFSNKIILSFHSLIIRSTRMTILVDTCVGNDKERPSRKGWHQQKTRWLEKLGQFNLHPEDIDVVLCTHLHADHVGWNTQLVNGRWVPTFPNARYVFSKDEYQYWQQANENHTGDMPLNHGCFGDSVLPVVEAGQSLLVDNDHQLDQGIWLEPAPGHTPGNVIVHVKAGEQHAILSGDVMHSAVQLANPNLSSRFCLDSTLSRRSRQQLLDTYVDTGVIMLPAHFPTPTAGRIVSHGSSFAYACCH